MALEVNNQEFSGRRALPSGFWTAPAEVNLQRHLPVYAQCPQMASQGAVYGKHKRYQHKQICTITRKTAALLVGPRAAKCDSSCDGLKVASIIWLTIDIGFV